MLLAGALAVDERGTRFLWIAKGLSYAQRREALRVAVALQATIDRPGSGSVACTTLNLGIGGAALRTEAPFGASLRDDGRDRLRGAGPGAPRSDTDPQRTPGRAPRGGLRQRNGINERALSKLVATGAAPCLGLAMILSAAGPRRSVHQEPDLHDSLDRNRAGNFVVAVKLIPPCLAVADRVLRPGE